MIKCFGRYCLAKIGLKLKSRFSSDARLIAKLGASWKIIRYVTGGLGGREQCPSKRKFRIQSHRFFKVLPRRDSTAEAARPQWISKTAQIRIVASRTVGRR